MQQTITRDATLEGTGVHTGERARVRFHPAQAGAGVRFRRVDLGDTEIPATLDHVTSFDRGTTLGLDEARIGTVEHLLAAVASLRIDNLMIDVDGPEVPIMDGSFAPFMDALRGCGIDVLDAPAAVLSVTEAVSVTGPQGGTYTALPSDRYRLSTTIEFDHPLVRRQFGSFDVAADSFAEHVAPARTFGFIRWADELRARGLALGVTPDNSVLLDETGLAMGELRFPDEFVRHKAGDIVGDLALLGKRLEAHVIAERPSHGGNLELARALRDADRRQNGGKPIIDIQKIMQHLPHRYPMLLVDRVVEFEAQKRIVGLKNVTINEPFFQGHYPGHPIMPGVLIVEAMAQVGGLLMMDAIDNIEDKVVYFMSLDNVKWRRPVTPGDQILFEVEMVALRRHVCRMKGHAYVDGQLVAEAELMARIVDR